MKQTSLAIISVTGGILLLGGCAGMSITPSTPGAYPWPCTPDPTPVFQFSATRTSGWGNVFDIRPSLLVNGEYLRMTGPSSLSSAGTSQFRYEGDIPYDGEVRYRFVVRYKVGYGFFASSSTARRPSDRYLHRPVGEISWSASSGHESSPLPPDFVDLPQNADERPRRFLMLGDTLIPGTSGPFSETATLSLTNAHTYPVFLDQPVITSRDSGSAVPELTIVPSDAASYPITLGAGQSVDFDITYAVTMDGSNAVTRYAGIDFPYQDTIRTCSLGPIWVDAIYSYNPP